MCPVGTQSIWTVWKSGTRLADGREIVYFDEAPGLGRDQIRDTRPLPPRMPGPELPYGRPDWGIRWDQLAGEWVVIAAARQDRAGAAHRDTGGQLRRGRVREPLSLAGRTPRPVRGGLLHTRPRRLVRPAQPQAGTDRARGLGGPDRGAARA